MATELKLHQEFPQSQSKKQPPQVPFNPSNWMAQEQEEDSWEIKAFEEDTSSILGATWPPSFYTCTFCKREFRSAQALGGHMNVHRRDRAKLHHHPPPESSYSKSIPSPPFIIPTREFVTNGGHCFLYSLPNPNGVLASTTVNSCINPPFEVPSPPLKFLLNPHNINLSSVCHSSNTEINSPSISNESKKECSAIEEIDLELRLGQISSTP